MVALVQQHQALVLGVIGGAPGAYLLGVAGLGLPLPVPRSGVDVGQLDDTGSMRMIAGALGAAWLAGLLVVGFEL
jgi:hypothetical protein